MQQQQQSAEYDLLAVFPDETKANTAVTSLQKAGFTETEVHQIAEGSVGSGEFRVHGPNAARREVFLQTQRSGPNPLLVVLLSLIFGLVVGGITFLGTFALPPLHNWVIFLIGIALGLVLGAILGLLRRGVVRGNIGQTLPPPTALKQIQGARNVVALRFADPENISRKSRARAILLNNQGKIDRSVGRLE